MTRIDVSGGSRLVAGLSYLTFAVALLLGGAGNDFPWLGAAVQLMSLVLIGAILSVEPIPEGIWRRLGLLLSLAIVALIVFQLVPLPWEPWSDAEGRALVARVRAFTGASDVQALTVDPAYTLQAGCELLPGLAMFLAASRARQSEQAFLFGILLLAAGVSTTLGVFQRSIEGLALFGGPHAAQAPGLFVNRNHQATFLLAAILLCPAALSALLSSIAPWTRKVLTVVVILFLAGGTVATTSRAGLLILPFALLMAAAAIVERHPRPKFVIAATIAGALLLWGAFQIPTVRVVLARFTLFDERALYWRDTWRAITAFEPWGSGIGTFTRVFPLYERDTLIDGACVNAAHNDYLQLLLEGGWPAAALGFAGGLLWITATFRVARARASTQRRCGLVASTAILIMVLHSLVDYPLRMLSLMAVMGLLAGVVLRSADCVGKDLPRRQ
jgi:O-antigen ligase